MSEQALIPTTFNSRDVGGGTVHGGGLRRGVLFRSDAPVRLDDRARTTLRALGVNTAVDLREPVERNLHPVDLAPIGIDMRHVPILGEDFDVQTHMSLGDIYIELLERRGAALTDAVRTLCEPGALPALVFCSAGKDRTGLVTALVLGALGANADKIVADYALTEKAMVDGFRAVIVERALAAGISEQEIAVKVGAPPELMEAVIEWLQERYEGAAEYLRRHGLRDHELATLRSAMVEPCAASAA